MPASPIVMTPLAAVPPDALVFGAAEPGVAMLEGWEGGGRLLLPWPEEVRVVPWAQAGEWGRELAAIEETVPADASFAGGWVGFISYEAMATGEGARPRGVHPPEPAMFFARHRAGVRVGAGGEAFLFAPVGELDAYARRLEATASTWPASARAGETVQDSLAHGAHARAVEAIRTAIRDGDVYQVNLTRSFTVAGAVDAGALYRTLTGATPPAMSAFLRVPRCTITSASPEVLLRFDRVEGTAETRPIKGTLRRAGDDAGEIAELLASGKDAAEHLMIVDVARNDLGKVAPAGQVSVTDYRRVQTLEHVHHLETTVRATGLRDRGVADVLAALSPAASITGAPKRAAVQMIRDLEPAARGVYCGSIALIGSASAEMSVAIRTAIVTDDAVRYHAGGGIVWDSDAQAEDDESRVKSAAFLRYVGAE